MRTFFDESLIFKLKKEGRKMKDVTPKSNFEILIRCLVIAVGIVAVIAFLKLAFSVFLSVAGWIIPIALILFLYEKFKEK